MIDPSEGQPSPTTRRSRRGRIWHCWSRPSETARHYCHVLLAVVFFFLAQLLTCAWDQPFWAAGLEFSGQIVAMVFVWLVMWAWQVLFCKTGEGLERFYHRYLKAPTEVLNKHMSIGFTVPFMNLISQSFVGADQVGLLACAFVVTGVLNSIFVYVVAYHVHLWIARTTCRPWRWQRRHRDVLDVEAAANRDINLTATTNASAVVPSQLDPRSAPGNGCHTLHGDGTGGVSCPDRFRKHISDVSTLCTLAGYVSDSNGPNLAYVEERRGDEDDGNGGNGDCIQTPENRDASTCPGSSTLGKTLRALMEWLQHNIFLTSSLLLFLLVGLPLACLRHNDLFLDIGFLFTVWLTFESAQTSTKRQVLQRHHHDREGHHESRKHLLTAIATLLNPVLWTSLFLVVYGLAKSHIRGESAADVVAKFTTNNTVSDLIAHHHLFSSDTDSPTTSYHSGSTLAAHTLPIGAGDVATSILNAGIVSWGLKLFEYRSQVASPGGATVVVTSALASLFNVVAWPLLACRIGVRPAASDLSFAARSVTIALGGPAMESLGGDAGVNAVGVVVNGICFQLVAGCFANGADGFGPWGAERLTRAMAMWQGWGWGRGRRHETPCADLTTGTDKVPQHARGDDDDDDTTPDLRYSSDATRVDDQQPQSGSRLPFSLPLRDGCTVGAATATTTSGSDGNSNGLRRCRGQPHGHHHQHHHHHHHQHQHHHNRPSDAVPTVAAGVTIGINAAAMGTAHLYEQNSHAAPYSALSMTVFGVFTVLFAVQGPMTEWIVRMVGGDTSATVMA